VKKKYSVSSKDKKDWVNFTKLSNTVYDKDEVINKQNNIKNKIKKLDLHGFSLDEANEKVKKFIIESFENGYKTLLVITGKGLRSKFYDDPYKSKKNNVLRYSVPEYIKNNDALFSKIHKISTRSTKDGGEGAFYIFLKNSRKL